MEPKWLDASISKVCILVDWVFVFELLKKINKTNNNYFANQGLIQSRHCLTWALHTSVPAFSVFPLKCILKWKYEYSCQTFFVVLSGNFTGMMDSDIWIDYQFMWLNPIKVRSKGQGCRHILLFQSLKQKQPDSLKQQI